MVLSCAQDDDKEVTQEEIQEEVAEEEATTEDGESETTETEEGATEAGESEATETEEGATEAGESEETETDNTDNSGNDDDTGDSNGQDDPADGSGSGGSGNDDNFMDDPDVNDNDMGDFDDDGAAEDDSNTGSPWVIDSLLTFKCDTSYPNLGPGSTQTCPEVGQPNNKGRLDCRTDPAQGGYSDVQGGWGDYRLFGSPTRYNGTKTRVERFFRTISRVPNAKTILTGILRIMDLSDERSCIIQSHAGGRILEGEEEGQQNRSAQFLVYARKSNGRIALDNHITSNPYTTTTGGSRTVIPFTTIDFNTEYSFRYETGYDASGRAFSYIKIGAVDTLINHTHTTQRVYTRYGAYGAKDTEDNTVHVQFKNIEMCRYE